MNNISVYFYSDYNVVFFKHIKIFVSLFILNSNTLILSFRKHVNYIKIILDLPDNILNRFKLSMFFIKLVRDLFIETLFHFFHLVRLTVDKIVLIISNLVINNINIILKALVNIIYLILYLILLFIFILM